uniref:Uncharacterized protein n=1 Tax=Rhizophora mucronata TaxID=61149 RepID=A0A2P2QP66_RHIMU
MKRKMHGNIISLNFHSHHTSNTIELVIITFLFF